MDRREVAAVLTYVGRLDPRTIRTDAGEARDQLAMWHELLGDVPMATGQGWDVREIVRKRIVNSPYPILPADVARDWQAHRRDRLARHTDPTPTADPDNPEAWRAELLAARGAVAVGQAAPRHIAGSPQGDPGRASRTSWPPSAPTSQPPYAPSWHHTARPGPPVKPPSPPEDLTSSACRATGVTPPRASPAAAVASASTALPGAAHRAPRLTPAASTAP